MTFTCDDADGDGLPDKCSGIGDGVHEVPGEYAAVLSVTDAGVLSAGATHWAKAPVTVRNKCDAAPTELARLRIDTPMT